MLHVCGSRLLLMCLQGSGFLYFFLKKYIYKPFLVVVCFIHTKPFVLSKSASYQDVAQRVKVLNQHGIHLFLIA